MRRLKLLGAGTAMFATTLIGLAGPAAADTTVIGDPDGTLLSVCITIRPLSPTTYCIKL